MNIDIFSASHLAALVMPWLALFGSVRVFRDEAWQSRILILGHGVALASALCAFATILGRPGADLMMGWPEAQVRFDLASSILTLGMTFISFVVLSFAERYMSCERYRTGFLQLLSALSSVAVLLVTTNSLIMVMLCWHLLSLVLWRLISFPDDERRTSASTVIKYHLLSDISLFAAVLIMLSSGVSTFSDLQTRSSELSQLINLSGIRFPFSSSEAICALLVFSFSVKSALFPFHRWLLATLEAPTPLSGLLHAGVVNVSAIVSYRMMPLLVQCPNILLMWGFLAAVSSVVGTASMAAQPDVKRKLVYSTIGQMGFMSLQCATGAAAAALLHLLAHGLFKCHLFLQSGGAVAEGLAKRKFYYGTDNSARSLSEVGKLGMLVLLAGGSAGLWYILYRDSALTALYALIVAVASLSALPTVRKIDYQTLAVSSAGLLLVCLLALGGTQWMDHLMQPRYEVNPWLFPSVLGIFATVSAVLWNVRESTYARAFYVHALSGFYVEDIAASLVPRPSGPRSSLNFLRREHE